MHKITLNEDHHNGHLNEENEGFDHCVPMMVHCESKDEAREIAELVSEKFGSENVRDSEDNSTEGRHE